LFKILTQNHTPCNRLFAVSEIKITALGTTRLAFPIRRESLPALASMDEPRLIYDAGKRQTSVFSCSPQSEFWMAILNISPDGIWVNSFFRGFSGHEGP
jgi:hypothetical protein